MTEINTDIACCGLGEIDGIFGEFPKDILRNIRKDFKKFGSGDFWDSGDFNGTFLVFSDIRKKKYGKALAQYIINNKLGEVVTMPSKKNPNSGSSLKVWLWRINLKNLGKWYKKHG